MGKRRKKSGSVTHKRAILTSARAVRGKPWKRVDSLLEELKEKHGYRAMSLDIFRLLWKLQRDNGWQGNAATQYAWEWYKENGYCLTVAGLLDHIDGTEFGLWLESQQADNSGWVRVWDKPTETVSPYKAQGDKYRAERTEAKRLAEENSERTAVELDNRNIWLRISRGEFPLGVELFETELKRLAMLRAQSVKAR